MFTDEAPQKPTLVQKLQAPASVVTYRALLGIFSAVTLGMMAFFGNRITDSQDKLGEELGRVRVEQAKTNGILNEDHDRIGNVEVRVNAISDKADALDHRVTILEVSRAR